MNVSDFSVQLLSQKIIFENEYIVKKATGIIITEENMKFFWVVSLVYGFQGQLGDCPRTLAGIGGGNFSRGRVYLFYYNIIGRYLVQIDESNVLVFLYTQTRMNNGVV